MSKGGSHGILAGQGTIGTRSYGPPNDRFRSFAERYLIERAGQFTRGKELEEGWQVIQDAKKLYQMIATASRNAEDTERQETAQQAAETKQQLIQAQQHVAKILAQAPAAPVLPSDVWEDRSMAKRFYEAVIQNRKDKT